MSGATADELEAALTKAGTVRLDAALKQLRFDRPCDAYFREELITAIRKFAVMTGDLELEAGCDARLSNGAAMEVVPSQKPALPLIRQDEQYRRAIALVLEAGRASVSMVQRKLSIRYSEAQELVARMLRDGIASIEDAPGLEIGAAAVGVKVCGSYECKAAQHDGVLCADGECDRENGARPDGSRVGALAGLADYLRLMAHSQSAPETLRRWAGEVDRIAGVAPAEAPNYCHPPEHWVNHPSGRSEPWCSKCEASPTRGVATPFKEQP